MMLVIYIQLVQRSERTRDMCKHWDLGGYTEESPNVYDFVRKKQHTPLSVVFQNTVSITRVAL